MSIQRLNFNPTTGDNPSEAFLKLDLNCADLDERVLAIEEVTDGLGDASTKDVGTAPGTVAAGDDARFLVDQGFISGMAVSRASASQVTVSSGIFYVPNVGYVYSTTALTTPSASLPASTWLHVYGFKDGTGNAAIELSSTAPSAPYFGAARTKTGDTTKRYLGSVLTDSSGSIHQFVMAGNRFKYVTPSIGATRVLSSGVATARTVVALSAWVPVTARMVTARLYNQNTSTMTGFVGTYGDGLSGATEAAINIYPSTQVVMDIGLYSPNIYYFVVSPSGASGMYIDVLGFIIER